MIRQPRNGEDPEKLPIEQDELVEPADFLEPEDLSVGTLEP